MAPPKGHKWYGGGAETETHDTIGRAASDKIRAGEGYSSFVHKKLQKPNVRKVINELMEERTKKTIAEANEVMEYFTSVMRGEVKDQFGLDAPLAERTNAAKELAKRTVDVDLRKQGLADNQITVTLNCLLTMKYGMRRERGRF